MFMCCNRASERCSSRPRGVIFKTTGRSASEGWAARKTRPVAPRPDIPGQPETRVPSDTTAQHYLAAGPSTSRPNDEIGELAERVMTACRTAEGQNLFGGYGSSGLTPAIQRTAARQSSSGTGNLFSGASR